MNTTIPVKNKKPFRDITNEWFDNAVPNYNKFKERKYIDFNGRRLYFDGIYIKFKYMNNEKEIAQLLQEKFGGTIYTRPKVDLPQNAQTADFKYINHRLKFNDYIDLKTIKSNGKNVIDNRIKKSRDQAFNFVLDFSESDLTYNEIINQLEMLYKNPYRNWVKTIIIIKNNDIRVFRRKNK